VTEIQLKVNGRVESIDVEAWVSVLDLLRERLGLTGTKKGCDQGACGACTVLVDGMRINACLALAVQYDGREITTIEGVAHPLQETFVRHDGFQCGYCTPGQICSAIGMLAEYEAGMPSAVTESHELSEAEIRERMSGNLCRCGAYNGILDAIMDVAGKDTR
jgi:xanthine dehydrogenase YagT iron-sulfur-binding subunit